MGEREAATAGMHGGEVEMGWRWASVGRHYTPCGPGAFSVGAGESEPTLSAQEEGTYFWGRRESGEGIK